MDSDGFVFQGAFDLTRPSVPLRCHTVMPAQSLASLTPVSVTTAFVGWLTAETPLTPMTPATVPLPINRRA